MSPSRRCSRTACDHAAEATMTYNYAQSTAVIGPLAVDGEPHGYDLCAAHAATTTAPRGWEIVRAAPEMRPLVPRSDDIDALADAVREAARPAVDGDDLRRGHLRMLRSPS
ncbi:MAG: DUF3499 domain-containing protein [Mycobacteriales bacterium]|nr:DUF3499 domain-containing protein [Frankia sp.]